MKKATDSTLTVHCNVFDGCKDKQYITGVYSVQTNYHQYWPELIDTGSLISGGERKTARAAHRPDTSRPVPSRTESVEHHPPHCAVSDGRRCPTSPLCILSTTSHVCHASRHSSVAAAGTSAGTPACAPPSMPLLAPQPPPLLLPTPAGCIHLLRATAPTAATPTVPFAPALRQSFACSGEGRTPSSPHGTAGPGRVRRAAVDALRRLNTQ